MVAGWKLAEGRVKQNLAVEKRDPGEVRDGRVEPNMNKSGGTPDQINHIIEG